MKLKVKGIIDPFYVQTLCMIFFPGAKFSEDAPEDGSVPMVEVCVEEKDGGVFSTARFVVNGKIASADNFTPYKEGVHGPRTAKISCGAAVITAGKQIFGQVSEWGMLTGVRPSKLAAEVLLHTDSREAAEALLQEEYYLTANKAHLVTEVASREMEILRRTNSRHCSLYVSIPFCPSKCTYCSFTSCASPRLFSLIPDYLVALKADIDRTLETVRRLGLTVDSVYVGGGTPTILTADQLEFLLASITAHIDSATLIEFTLEGGRPDTITQEKLAIARKYGVDRLSVNPQTLNNEILRAIGRNHTVEEFLSAYRMAEASGIPHINTDLIAGLPGESAESFRASVDAVLALSPDNVTVHTFCVKRAADILRADSNIYNRETETAKESVTYSQSTILSAGYVPYYMYRQKNTVGNFENVGFSKPGAEGVYNVFMMQEAHTIFGVGAGAVTKLVCRRPDASVYVERLFYPKYPYEYLAEKENGSSRATDMERKITEFYKVHKEVLNGIINETR
ncbi:MAG: coproporphyrinogen dehydrogenase HemZ [Clostridia bacterium]|nr:coproporphyrinogen dehydrogenase HemZ [Clostridia bacterium]